MSASSKRDFRSNPIAVIDDAYSRPAAENRSCDDGSPLLARMA